MAKQKKKLVDGIVYSTDSSFEYVEETNQEETLSPGKQLLKVQRDRKQRGGKVATLVSGFVGTENDLFNLGKILKQRCGVGGAVKHGEILIQGDCKEKVMRILEKEGYRVKGVGG